MIDKVYPIDDAVAALEHAGRKGSFKVVEHKCVAACRRLLQVDFD